MTGLTILHLSDTHLLAGGARHYGVTDTTAALRLLLARLDALGPVDAVVCTGDLSEDGSAESYATLRGLIEPWAVQHGARVLYTMGNHDLAEPFRAELDPKNPHTGLWGSERVGAQRFIRLDTSIPGSGAGEIGPEQLDWLRDQLSGQAPGGTVIAMHHPPVTATTPLLQMLGLRDADAFWRALDGSDVRLVLAGHYHHARIELRNGVMISVAPGVTNQADLLAAPGEEAAVPGSGASLVRLGGRGSVRVEPVLLSDPADRIFLLDAEKVADIGRSFG